MKPALWRKKQLFKMSDLEESSVPDLLGGKILQNDLHFFLGENEEIFEGYGTKKTSYPYRQQNCYTRKLSEKELDVYVLENDFLQATFLPSLGGRLWSLLDKKSGRNLLYTNDVIRFSNLAVRNAWFSGGVEWNIGIIGHTPFTCEALFSATYEMEDGTPVLRMYEQEQIRGVEYQMDFWLGEQDTALNCRMRITNTDQEVKPMYWWSNMAVSEFEGGQVIVPATKAYSPKPDGIHKVDVHQDEGIDALHYKDIPGQTDYFFDIPAEKPKFIANIDENGYGLLQLSTDRLKSRKLFSWGKKEGSNRWQQYLTEHAGRYVEIQAGLGKTQYGCIPMPGHSAWEWMEQYGPLQLEMGQVLEKDQVLKKDQILESEVTKLAAQKAKLLEQKLNETAQLAKTKVGLDLQGNYYGAWKRETALTADQNDSESLRASNYIHKMTGHLDFGKLPQDIELWKKFLTTGIFPKPASKEKPDAFLWDAKCVKKLRETIDTVNSQNYYAYYQLGIYELYLMREEEKIQEKEQEKTLAERYLWKSLELEENPWAYHALACLKFLEKEYKSMKTFIQKGLSHRRDDVGYVKDCFRMLVMAGCFREVLEEYGKLSEVLQLESRLYFCQIQALHGLGKNEKAYHLLCDDETYELADVREGDDPMAKIWLEINEAITGRKEKVPERFYFGSF